MDSKAKSAQFQLIIAIMFQKVFGNSYILEMGLEEFLLLTKRCPPEESI